jgi:hypothetical protein
VVFSDTGQPSPVSGGVFLHQGIPGIHDGMGPDGVVQLRKVGEAAGYARKVYGSPAAPTSWQRLREGATPAWALAPLYERLWATYEAAVVPMVVDHEEAGQLLGAYRLVMSSAPALALCGGGHDFPSRPVWYVDRAPDLVAENEMVYNGLNHPVWFRSSRVFGVPLMEFGKPLKGQAMREGRKVLPTNCTCHPRIARIGRWGTWTPGVLLHHAYWGALEAMASRGL